MEAITKYIETTMQNGGTTDNRQIRKVCEQNGINLDEKITKVKEAVEIGLMHVARSIAQSDKSLRQKYDELIDLYNRQPYVGTKKTLKQMVLQQYSTPLPIAFLMSEFVKNKSNSSLYFEPSAGNGFLTISLPQENTICNEIDRYRLDNLKNEHYRKVSEQDARQPFEYNRIFDGVVTNPPFLKGQETNAMIFNALETMKDSGRCAILRDGNAQFTEYAGTKLRSSFTGFYDKLFQEYNVVKIININAKKIYAKQGTSFFMHIILINGRRANKLSDDDTIHRVYNPDIDKIDLAGFEELWECFSPYFIEQKKDTKSVIEISSLLLIKELGLLIKKNDVFIEPLKGAKEKNSLTQKEADQLKYYIVTDIYEVGDDTKIALNITSRVDGCNKVVFPIDYFLSKKLKYAYHAHQLDGLGSLDPDFVIEYHCNGEIYYDLSEARKNGNKIKATIFGTDITMSVSNNDTDFDVRQKLSSCEYEYVQHGLQNRYKKIKKNEFYRVVFTKYSYLCHTDKNGNLIIDKRYDTRETDKISGIYATPFGRPNTTRSIGNIGNIQKQPIYARQTCKGYIQNTTNNRIRFVENSSSTLTGTRPTQIAELNGLTAEQWQNYLAQNEDWISLNIKYSETEYHNNVITIQKPTASFANYRGGEDGYIHYWFHCKKDEIDGKIKVIDKVFNIIIDEFPEWKTENPIISYRPRKDTYHEGYYSVIRELRFTKKENEKFLQVIPFFLKMLTITHEQIHFNAEYVKTLKYCKFQAVAEKVSELAKTEAKLLEEVSLSERIRLNFTDAPKNVLKELQTVSNLFDNNRQFTEKQLKALNIKDVMWECLSKYPYDKQTVDYILNKRKDSKDKMLPKWVNIIYNYLCEKYGVKKNPDNW